MNSLDQERQAMQEAAAKSGVYQAAIAICKDGGGLIAALIPFGKVYTNTRGKEFPSGATHHWESCFIGVTRDDTVFIQLEKEGSPEVVLFDGGEEAETINTFRPGPWVERFLVYSQEQQREEKLGGFQDIDF